MKHIQSADVIKSKPRVSPICRFKHPYALTIETQKVKKKLTDNTGDIYLPFQNYIPLSRIG